MLTYLTLKLSKIVRSSYIVYVFFNFAVNPLPETPNMNF